MSHFDHSLKPKHIKQLLKPVKQKHPHSSLDLKLLQHSNKPSKQKTTFFATASDLLGVFENFLHWGL